MTRVAEVFLIFSVLLLSGCSGYYSTLDPAGPYARSVAWIWWGMFIVATLVLFGVCGLWWYAMRKRSRDYSDLEVRRVLNRFILAGGTGLPVVAMTVLLAFGIPEGHKMMPWPDARALHIDVHAKRWEWQVKYPKQNIQLTDEIHIPVDTPIDVYVTSADVIHGFWVPRLGGKIDAIPGRTNVVRIQADKPGSYGGQCAEYCGQSHAFMKFEVVAHSASDFKNWLAQQHEGKNE
ncbi:cytochrome c oxidase subunit II [Alteromonas pelagimontana]|uniref:cytochrome-c oxidase n=1 Tax=Alteromonas pelagimontana TaxID=1858656 RepID=A0A6M4MHF4_9ALTE|nr:cytochrome c oxidase subunit II [Alteromonas pelagimontana]QJR82634.1 cytochrome c oxidase subunit II [Alteromonas pelagimontana]